MAVLLASWTQQYKGDGLDYTGAAEDQLNYLFDVVPHTEDGAISHIVKDVELWVRTGFIVYFCLMPTPRFRRTACTWSLRSSPTSV